MNLPRAIFLLLATVPAALADGGMPIGQSEADGLRITLFASPLPVRAGPMDAGVLVQEIPSNRPAAGAEVRLSVRLVAGSTGRPVRMPAWCSTLAAGSDVLATSAHSANKLLVGAYLPLSEPGRWEVAVEVAHRGRVTRAVFPLDVAPPPPPLAAWWPFLAMVPAAIALYAWRARILRRPA